MPAPGWWNPEGKGGHQDTGLGHRGLGVPKRLRAFLALLSKLSFVTPELSMVPAWRVGAFLPPPPPKQPPNTQQNPPNPLAAKLPQPRRSLAATPRLLKVGFKEIRDVPNMPSAHTKPDGRKRVLRLLLASRRSLTKGQDLAASLPEPWQSVGEKKKGGSSKGVFQVSVFKPKLISL